MKNKAKKTTTRRISVAPEGGDLAELGFYTRQVQAVVRKWNGKVRPDMLEDYFRAVAMPVFLNKTFDIEIKFRFVINEHWPLVFELGKAISSVLLDDKNIDKWLLALPISVATNGEWESWDSLSEFIGKRVGQAHSTGFSNTVKARAKRLRILTPPHMAAAYLSSRPMHPAVTKTPPKT